MRPYRDLVVWQRSHQLLLRIYEATRPFPTEEKYGLVSQLRRAALSVPTNIVDGSKRTSNPDFARYLNISEASLAETEYLLLVSRDLGYLSSESHQALTNEANEIARMIYNLRTQLG